LFLFGGTLGFFVTIFWFWPVNKNVGMPENLFMMDYEYQNKTK
jgi:hypothetical protein